LRQHIPFLVLSWQTAWLHISQGCNLNISCCEDLRSFSVVNVYISFCFVTVNYGQIPQASSTKPICGIVGTLQLLAGPYLVIITKKHKVGSINGQTIWQVVETEVISYTRTLLHLTEKQVMCCRSYTCIGL
jgi:Phosphoinositide polyphosphatase (Sac family)